MRLPGRATVSSRVDRRRRIVGDGRGPSQASVPKRDQRADSRWWRQCSPSQAAVGSRFEVAVAVKPAVRGIDEPGHAQGLRGELDLGPPRAAVRGPVGRVADERVVALVGIEERDLECAIDHGGVRLLQRPTPRAVGGVEDPVARRLSDLVDHQRPAQRPRDEVVLHAVPRFQDRWARARSSRWGRGRRHARSEIEQARDHRHR